MIDSHHHLWKYNPHDYVWMAGEMESLRRDFLITDLKPLMRETGVTGLVTVQARQMVDETEWLFDLAKQHQEIRGIVGWVPLVEENVGEILAKFAANPAPPCWWACPLPSVTGREWFPFRPKEAS